MSELISAQYAVAMSNHEPAHFTMIPNIIDHLTYDAIDKKTGESVVKRLSVYSIHLYKVLRNISGSSNLIWMNSLKIAEIANMSDAQVMICKRELSQKFHQLDNTPLINIFAKKKATKKDDCKVNTTIYHEIHINPIWTYNNAFFALKKIEKNNPELFHAKPERTQMLSPVNQLTKMLSEHPEPTKMLSEPLERAHLPAKCNNKQIIKTPLSKEQQPTASADRVCSLVQDDCVLATVDKSTEAYNWLIQQGCSQHTAVALATTYSSKQIQDASQYVALQMQKALAKGQKIKNAIAYLRKALENNWKVKET